MRIKQKIFEDFLKPSRLPLYMETLMSARDAGYHMLGILDFWKMVSASDFTMSDHCRCLINRHDIDTSPKVARKMFEIEQEVYGKQGSATYYFRDSTIDKQLIKDIDAYGYETGYHYEELADFAKKYRIKSAEKLKTFIPEIQKLFLRDLNKFRLDTGSKSFSVSSHGDFVNTKLMMQSYELLRDQAVRTEGNICVEAYDHTITQYIQARYADQVLQSRFSDEVIQEINHGTNVIMILTHPRNWAVDFGANIRENVIRILQGIKYEV